MIGFDIVKTMCYSVENQLSFVCRDLEEDDFHRRVDDKYSAIGWIIGHILFSHDYIINHSMLGNQLFLSEDVSHFFSTGSSGDFPPDFKANNFFSQLKEVNAVIVNDLKTIKEEWFYEFPLKTEFFPPFWLNKNNYKVIILHFSHALTHCGQILELRRLMGKETWGI